MSKMKEISIMLNNIEPVSVNHSHGFGKGFRYKLPKTKKFEIELNRELSNFKDELNDFCTSFNWFNHVVHCSYFIYIPEKIFFTKIKKQKKVSRKSKDLDNMLKVMQDNIFKFIGIDDTFITRLEAEKIPTKKEEWSIVVQLSIRPLFVLEH